MKKSNQNKVEQLKPFMTNILQGRILNSIESRIQNLEGKILTIIDASESDKEKREALKSLVRREYHDISWTEVIGYEVYLLQEALNNKYGNTSIDIPSYLKNNVWPEENPYRNCDLVQ